MKILHKDKYKTKNIKQKKNNKRLLRMNYKMILMFLIILKIMKIYSKIKMNLIFSKMNLLVVYQLIKILKKKIFL